VRRRLHTDADISIVTLRRCIIITSIDAGALRGDLADRLVVAELERLAPHERRAEVELAQLLDAEHPRMLGGLLTLASRVLAELPRVAEPELPRLTSYGRIVAALDRITGSRGLERLAGLEQRLATDVLEGDEVALAVLRKLDDPLGDQELVGTASELLDVLTPEAPSRTWPRTPRAFAGRVRRIAPALRLAGVSVRSEREGHDRRRILSLKKQGEKSSAPSAVFAMASLSEKPADGEADGADRADGAARTVRTIADGWPEPLPSADFPHGQADFSASPDGADGADGVISSDLEEEVEKGSLEWIARASAAELEDWDHTA
jgi:hypothetical protein